MSPRLKILFASISGVIVLAVVFVVVLRSRSAEPTQSPEAPATIPSQTLPTASVSVPAPANTNSAVGTAPAGTSVPASGQPTSSAPGTSSGATLDKGFAAATSIVDIPAGASVELTRGILAQTARLIAERFGTFSSQNAFQNLRDLQPFMTASLSTWLDGYMSKLGQSRSAIVYSSTATVALRANVKEFDETAGRATVLVATSRTEVSGGKKATSPHDFEVKFLRESNAWKIDNLRWLK